MIMRITAYLLFGILCTTATHAQVYMGNRTQHRFAQSYFGFNVQVQPASGSYIWDGKESAFPMISSPRVTLGGLHFWGKLDFNMNFPITRFADFNVSENAEMYFNSGADLSARFYPWRVTYNAFRPYLGYSANEMTLGFEDDELGYRYDLFITSSAIAGVSFARNGLQVNAELMWMLNNKRNFYSNRTDEHTFELPRGYFSVGIVRFFEGTLREEKDMQSGKMKRMEEQLRHENKLNSFSVGFAPSGAYSLLAPDYDGDEFRQSLPRHKGNIVWEYSLGYLLHDAGLHLGFSYRDYTSDVESFDFEHLMRRRSVAFEVLKFIGNYNGFVPFVGPTLIFDRWAVGEFLNNEQLGNTVRTSMLSPGIIFGWDILASPLETWVLRTNLRYYPFQKIKDAGGGSIRIDQFEFNFIQLLIYPNRLVHIPKLKGRI